MTGFTSEKRRNVVGLVEVQRHVLARVCRRSTLVRGEGKQENHSNERMEEHGQRRSKLGNQLMGAKQFLLLIVL